MPEVKGTWEKVTMGSGLTYLKEFAGALPEIGALLTEMIKDEYLLGYTKSGASLEYKPTYSTEKDDMGYKVKEVLTEEEMTYKTGLFTWNGDSLSKLSSTARVETKETTVNGSKKKFRILKLGGVGNDNGKQYVVVFKHEDPVEGDCYTVIVGRNASGFTITFDPEKATTIDAEFTCKPQDKEGTLVQFVEELDDPVQTYTQTELEAMTIDQIKEIATARSYTITKTVKTEIITEFLAAQTAAQA